MQQGVVSSEETLAGPSLFAFRMALYLPVIKDKV